MALNYNLMTNYFNVYNNYTIILFKHDDVVDPLKGFKVCSLYIIILVDSFSQT